MNRRKSGRMFEIWCRNWLKEQGYQVHLAGKKVVKYKNRYLFIGDDIFGVFDILAISPQEIRLIQCSKHEAIKKRLDELKDLMWLQQKAYVELWIKRPNGVVDILRLKDQEFIHWGKIIRKKLFILDIPAKT